MTTRVLQVLGRSAGGIARHVAEITASLDGTADLAIDIAGPPGLPLAMPKQIAEVSIPDGPFGHGSAIRRIRSLVNQRDYAVVHAHGLRAGIDAAVAASKSGARVVVTIHNLVRPEVAGRVKAVAYKPAERLVVKLADKILAVSRDIAGHLSRYGNPDRIEVMHLGVEPEISSTTDPAAVKRALGLGPDDGLVVTASRLSAQKALHVMLEAMAQVDATLAIAGEGPLGPSLRARAAQLGISARVRFLGFRDDVADLIAGADVFCLSSVWEGVPLAAMEAVRFGTPVVATDVGGTGELIEDRVSGRLVAPGDPDALASAVAEVLGDPGARERYVVAARAKLASDFSTEGMLARLRDIYLGDRR